MVAVNLVAELDSTKRTANETASATSSRGTKGEPTQDTETMLKMQSQFLDYLSIHLDDHKRVTSSEKAK